MKFKYLFLTLVLTAFLSSYMPNNGMLKEGSEAPAIERLDGRKENLRDGKTRLVSFWNPKNPSSRISNKRLSEFCSDSDVEFISICTDSDVALMQEVLRMDDISTENALAYSDLSPRVFKDYGVEDHPAAFLISPKGKIEKISQIGIELN